MFDETQDSAAESESNKSADSAPTISQDELNKLLGANAAPNVQALGATLDELFGDDTPLDNTQLDDVLGEVPPTAAPAVDASEMALGNEDWVEPGASEPPPPTDVIDAEEKREPLRLPTIQISLVGFDKKFAKLAASLLFGIACGLVMFSWLVLNQDRLTFAESDSASGTEIIRNAVASAEGHIEDGLYDHAALELDDALKAAPRAANRNDAEYAKIKAEYLRLAEVPDPRESEHLLSAMGNFAENAADHPRITEVMRWRGDVYDRSGIPSAALSVYNDLLTNYVAPLDGDRVLLGAGKAALELNRPQQAADCFRRLRQEYPGSPIGDEAGLYQGDAYRQLGSPQKAKFVYQQIAITNPATRLGGQAYARLAQLSYDAGAYDDAIDLLETRLATATTTDGNEDAYLILARSLRATGQHKEAERVLRELTQFFPENPRSAEAMVELSQVMEARGRRPEAANIARQAAQRFPKDSLTLENAAVFLAQAGDERGAAESLLNADAAGARNPTLLLNAARHYAETGESKEAQRTYEQLLETYGDSPEAFDGRIELASIYFNQGKVQKAIDWLEDLSEIHAGGPKAVPVLLALSDHYSTLGLHDRAAAAQKKVVAGTRDQEELAQAAAALMEGADIDAGLAAAHQVDVERLPAPSAYRFLRAHGLALREVDDRRALAQLERAYMDYPKERKSADATALLELYLAAGRTGTARALVMDVDAIAKSDISAAPELIKASVLWGDHLFERRDFRAAAEAYSLAESAVAEEGDSLVAWAKLQRASALLQLRDASTSVSLLAEVSESGTAWSDDAELRQAYAEVERRLAHGKPRTPNGG